MALSLASPRRSSAVGEYEEAVAQIGAQEESSELVPLISAKIMRKTTAHTYDAYNQQLI